MVGFLLSVLVVLAADVPATTAPPRLDPMQAQVEVTLISDGETWVSIGKVLQPAKFKTRRVRLAPGDYEVRGSRKGYFDVRKALHVGGSAVPELTVTCTEQVRN
jgi:hypothetical protein